jgi:hypothetical protein
VAGLGTNAASPKPRVPSWARAIDSRRVNVRISVRGVAVWCDADPDSEATATGVAWRETLVVAVRRAVA